MPRYAEEYGNIPARGYDRGMDPNHRGGYRGMRMISGPHQAAYGWHRWTHGHDFEGSGGFRGRHGRQDEGGRERFLNFRPRYDRDLRGGGGVHDWRYDTEYLRDFNSNSSRFEPDGRWGRGTGPRRGAGRPSRYDGGFRWERQRGQANEAGFADSWAWGPMRGAR
jgi:hypothetical protein